MDELLNESSFPMLLNKRGGVVFWTIKIANVLSRVDAPVINSDCSSYAVRVVTMLLVQWGVVRAAKKDEAAQSSLAFHVEELSRRLSGQSAGEGDQSDKPEKSTAVGTMRDPLQLMTARLLGVRVLCF